METKIAQNFPVPPFRQPVFLWIDNIVSIRAILPLFSLANGLYKQAIIHDA